jgi:hypothetical protein
MRQGNLPESCHQVLSLAIPRAIGPAVAAPMIEENQPRETCQNLKKHQNVLLEPNFCQIPGE